jgi:hypothetical protein
LGPIKGGGGGDTGGDGTFTSRVITATLELPDTLASLRSGLRLNTSLSEATFSGAGTAKATLYGQGPQILIASQSDDTPVLLGWADASAGKLSPQTTAEVLVYIATGAHMLHPDAARVVRSFLTTAPAVASLASQVTTALAADSKALARTDGALAAAVTQTVRTITPPRGRAVKVDPSQEKSGIQPIQQGATQVQLQHTVRRRAFAYIEQIGYLEASPTGGAAVRRDLSAPRPITSFDVPRTTGVSSVNGVIVDGLMMGQTAYGPVVSDPVTLLLQPDSAVGTIYRLVTVGPSGGPMIASERPYFTRERDDKFMALTGLTMVFDWAISLVLNTILGLEGAPGVPGYGAFANDIGPDCANFLISTVPGALDKLVPNGDFVGVGKDLAYALATSNSARSALGLIVIKLYGLLAAKKLVTTVGTAALGKLVERALVVFSVAGAALNAFDILVTMDNVGQANPIDSWEVTVTQPKVTLSPETATVKAGDTLSLLARVVDEVGSTNLVTYHWKITSGTGTLRNPVSGATGTSLDSASQNMTYQSSADAADKETITIEMEAFLGSVNNTNRTSLGKGSSTLTISKQDNLIKNGDFAAGFANWSQVKVAGGGLSGYPRFSVSPPWRNAIRPDNPAAFIDVPGGSIGYISQSVVLPNKSLKLSFVAWNSLQPAQLSIIIVSGGAQTVLDTIQPASIQSSDTTASDADATPYSYPLDAFKGKTIEVRFQATSGGINGTVIGLDDISIR